MSLAQAVLDVAEAMEQEADVDSGFRILRSFARELRTAVKAAANESLVDLVGKDLNARVERHNSLLIPSHSNPGLPQPEEKQEEGERMVLCVYGSFHDDLVPVAADVPVGAFLPVCDKEVYQLTKDDKGQLRLKFSSTQTQRFQNQRGGRQQ